MLSSDGNDEPPLPQQCRQRVDMLLRHGGVRHGVGLLDHGVFALAQPVEGEKVDLADAVGRRQLRRAGDVLHAVVDVVDQGNADDHLRAAVSQTAQVVQDLPVGYADVRTVHRVVHGFYVIEHAVALVGHRLQVLVGGEAGGFDGGVDALLPQGCQHRGGKLPLQQHLAAGERHAAAGIVVVHLVPEKLLHQLLYRHLLRRQRQRAGAAVLHAGQTPAAVGTVQVAAADVPGTDLHAAAAADALVPPVEPRVGERLGLRIGAPAAAQGTALKEHHRADAAAVMDAVFLDVVD